MDDKHAKFLKRLRATFRVEADAHIRSISSGLIDLEKSQTPEKHAEILEVILREAHSLKGAARSVELKDIESVCQPLEGAFSALKHQSISLSPERLDLFHQTLDFLNQLLPTDEEETPSADRARVREFKSLLKKVVSSGNVASSKDRKTKADHKPVEPYQEPIEPQTETIAKQAPAEIIAAGSGRVRVSTNRLESLLLQAEELIQVKLAAEQRNNDLKQIHHAISVLMDESKKWTDRVKTGDDSTFKDWHQWNEKQLKLLVNQITLLTNALNQDQRTTKNLVDEHLEEMRKILMLPASLLVETFPKIVRDLARDQGKDVDVVVNGQAIEIDKRILDELRDPINHLLRNCVDHGIEKPDTRASLGKATRGTITISFETKSNKQIEILISDDGAGIDAEQVLAAAIKAKTIAPESTKKLDDQDILSLIFQSGVSTSRIITDISGRGLGMAIVREKVEKLGGVVSIESRKHEGTTFKFLLPLTLASFRGILVAVDEHVFVLPTLNVQRTLRVNRSSIKTVENRETINVDGQILPLIGLDAALNLQVRKKRTRSHNSLPNEDYLYVAVVAFSEKRLAFRVDEILDEQQVMVKGLGPQLKYLYNVAGAAVLGSGKIVPVINVSDLMKSAMRVEFSARPAEEEEFTNKGKVLVAEDSITSRTLIKNILESSGYDVTTAVDGADAYDRVLSETFDLVVSDVDMPNMSGFELTTKIRSEKKLSEIPVVLVTALESKEDRERGIDAGADAYIVKSSFDQSNLLEVIQRLL